MTLVEFLLARIADDEALGGPPDEHGLAWCDADEGVHYTAARVLAECEAKRRIMESCLADFENAMNSGDDTTSLAEEVLRTLALPYDDHEDYRDEWKP